MSRRPHPAPMRRQRRSPVLHSAASPLPGPALTGPWPTVTRSQGARHAAPHPCLAPPPAPIAPHHLSTAPLPPAPIGLASSASRPSRAVARIASTPLRAAIRIPLCRHRADSALIAPHHDHRAPPPSYTCCASPSASRPPRADIRVTPHLSPRVAAAPGPWLARTAPYASLFRRMREKGPLPGNIRPAFPRQRHAVRPNGLCAMRQRHAVRPNGPCALRRRPGLLAACAPPRSSRLCPPRPAVRPNGLRRPRPATRSPYRRISPPARRTHPASRADPPRPGNKRNNANNSMRA